MLCGCTHRVMTARYQNGPRHAALNVSHVRFASVEKQLIAQYVASGEPLGKAGARAIQGRAAAFIEHISGSHSGIMGLPMFETAQLLRHGPGFKNRCKTS